MKSLQRRYLYWLVAAWCLVPLVGTSQGQARPGVAVVRAIRGSAFVVDAQNQKTILHIDQALRSNCRIETGPESQVDLMAKHVGPIHLRSNTTLIIDKLSVEAVDPSGKEMAFITRLNLKAGRVYCQVGKMAAASLYEVRFPGGSAGIRGTVFAVNANGIVRCYAGGLRVVYDPPDSALPSGAGYRSRFSAFVNAGQTCSPPKTSSEAPLLTTTPDPIQEEGQQLIQSWHKANTR